MRRLLGIGLLSMALLVLGAPKAHGVTLEEIILLCKTGVSAEIVLENLRQDPNRPRLSVADAERLRREGVPEKVIAFLQAGDSKRAQPTPSSEETHRRQKEARLKEADALRHEAEKLRQEARRLAEEARRSKALTDEAVGRVKAELAEAYDDLRKGRSHRAISGFHRFLHSGLVQPNAYAYVEATFGLALAFQKANMPHSAASQLVEVIRRGPLTPRFAEAVAHLVEILDRIDFIHPVLALLAEFERDVSSQPRSWLDEYHFLLGEFYEHYDDAKRARRHFAKISSKSRRYSAARYHLGVLHTAAKNPRTGVAHFREALRRARGDRNQEIVELSSLALARLAFEVGSYQAAEHFYRQVPRVSRHFGRAQYELAWTHVMAEKYADALGTIHGLSSPFLRQVYGPDRWVLEAATYLNLCRTKEASQALKRFATDVVPSVEKLRSLLEGRLAPGALLAAVQALAADRPSSLPTLALRAAVADVGVYRAHASFAQLLSERRLAQRYLDGPVRAAVLAALDVRGSAYRARLDLELRRRLRDVLVELDMIKVKADEIGLEVELAEQGGLEEERRRMAAGKSGPERRDEKRTRRIRPGPGQQTWPFVGEYWLDELGAYRSALRSACPRLEKQGAKETP